MNWLFKRLQEPSTYAGIMGLAMAAQQYAPPGMAEQAAAAAGPWVAVLGAVLAATKGDPGNK